MWGRIVRSWDSVSGWSVGTLLSPYLHFNQDLFGETKWAIWGGSLCEKGKLFRIEMKLNKKSPWKVFLFFSGIIALEDWEQVLLVVCRSWQTPYFWSPEPASWRPLGFNTKQWTVNFLSKVLMEATRKTSCCNANAGSKVWLWQMLKVDGGEKVVCYWCTTHLTTSYIVRPPSPLWQAYNLVHCFCQPELMHTGLLLVFVFQSFSLYIISSWTLSTSSAWSTYLLKQHNNLIHCSPPIKRVVGPTLLFGRHPFLSSGFLSCSVYSLWSGKAACFGPGGLIKWSCRVYNPMLTSYWMTYYHQ